MLKISLMRKTPNYPNPDSDARVLSATLRRLCLPKWVWRGGVITVTAFVWLWISQQILTVGNLIRYDGLQSLGEQVVSFMTRINPYLWMGIVAILTLIVLSLLRSWLKANIRLGRESIVSVSVIQSLAQKLSLQGIDVLKWVWRHEEGPVTIGDLLRARDQIRSGRVRKLSIARTQHRLLEEARSRLPQEEEKSEAIEASEPTLTAPAPATFEIPTLDKPTKS
jgi:hypothetical protein